MKRWDEMGKSLGADSTSWKTSRASFDTTFNHTGETDLQGWDNRELIRNPGSMLPRQFEKYTEQLRKLRPKFKQFLLKEEMTRSARQVVQRSSPLASERSTIRISGDGQVDMFASAQASLSGRVESFLAEHLKEELLENPNSTKLGAQPHRYAGLGYTTMNPMQTRYLSKPIPGRVLPAEKKKEKNKDQFTYKDQLVAAAGIIGDTPRDTVALSPTDLGDESGRPRTNKEHGTGMFRLTNIELGLPPSVVGSNPETPKDSEWRKIQFTSITRENANVSNPYPLGSPEYVAMPVGRPAGLKTHVNIVKASRTVLNQRTTDNDGLLTTISSMIKRTR